jgi:hypothetical protein
MNDKETSAETSESTTHPNKIAGIGSQIRFQPSGETGKGKRGTIKSLKAKGITVTVIEPNGKNGKDKETDFLIQPAQVTKFYAMNDGQVEQ